MRIESQLGYVLHTVPYRETSLLVDLFTKQYGRIRCVAKGFRKPSKKGLTRALFPYTEYRFNWQGRGDLKTLTQAETVQAPIFLRDECLFTGLYINELFYRLLHEHDPHEFLFEKYQQFLIQLESGIPDELKLRLLEVCVLQELGYGLAIESTADKGLPLNKDRFYSYIPDQGLIEAKSQEHVGPHTYLGSDLICLSEGEFEKTSAIKTAKRLLRAVIDFYLDGRKLNSRDLYRQHLQSNVTSSKKKCEQET